jgi:hypothetical protein
MVKETTVAETRPAGMTIEFVAVANLVPALGAFYASVDQLKHREFAFQSRAPNLCSCGTCRLTRFHQAEQYKNASSAFSARWANTARNDRPHRGFKLHRIGLSQCRGGKSADCRDRDSD